MNKIKNLVIVSLCALFILIFPVWGIIAPDGEISKSERRPLEKFPDVNIETILGGTFMTDFESYTLDHFPLRDGFRTLKSITSFYLFNQKDNNDIFIHDGHAVKLEYPYNESSVNHATERFEYVFNTYLKDKGSEVYLSVIPDKNYFIPENAGYLSIDYDKLIEQTRENMPYAQYIDIVPTLELSDYYCTDTHWKQECIEDVAEKLCTESGAGYKKTNYTEKTADTPFYGVYYGQSALPLGADTIKYLESSTLSNMQVYDFETNSYLPVYNTELLSGNDPYEMYLSGPKSLLVMENKNATTDKKLIIFRDSFTSALAPLMIENYSEITLVDIRYLSPNMLGNFIEFDGQDVLFLYSTSVLNNSITIK